MKKLLVCAALVVMSKLCYAQFSRYIIQFKDKATSPFSLSSPSQYLSERSIDRRTRYGIAVDSTDLPVTPRYIDSIRLAGSVTVLNASKWLNQISIQTTDAAALAKINSFPFVKTVAPIAARIATGSGRNEKETSILRVANITNTTNTTADFFNYGQSFAQVHIHNGEFLHNIGLRGQNMVIGILDAGFRNYTTLKSFDSVNSNGQVLGTYDFVARETGVVEDDSHGMQCFSVIAANIPGQFVGTAPKANFYLFRSEDASSEYPIEEHNWVCAAERVDSSGGDVISSSLGYSNGMSNSAFNHTYAEMNGNTTMAARGADLAAGKGILVGNSAGNDGGGSFHFISTPADGDSVMAVGAVAKDSSIAGFSSYGPSSDGQVKPDVTSVGVNTVIQTTANTIGVSNGTSFSCPNIVGLAACLWQGFREFNNIKILNTLRQSGHKASSPDNRVGYGIPDVKKAVMILLKEYSTANGSIANCKTGLSWTSKDMSGMRYEIERLVPGQGSFQKIAEVNGTGNSFSSRNYNYEDNLVNLPTGTIIYRIRQVIDTAAATFTAGYIDTVTVTSLISCVTENAVTLMPNPSVGPLTIKVSTTTDVPNLVMRLFNSKGQLLADVRKSQPVGTAFYELPVHYLPAGQYYLSVYKGQELLETKSLIKL